MNNIDRYVFKLLTENITTSEFEQFLYQEENLYKLKTNTFIYNLIDINYRDSDHLNTIRKIAKEHYNDLDFLLIELRFSCLKIIEANRIEDVKSIIFKYSTLHSNHNYEIGLLDHFYKAKNYLDLINENLEYYTKKEIFNNIKGFARIYLDAFDLKKDNQELLKLTNSKTYKESLTYFQEEDIINYLSNEKIEFTSNNSIRKRYIATGFRGSYVENAIEKIEKASLSKLKTRFFTYTVIGMPFFYVGTKALEKEENIPFVWFIGFAGLVLLVFSIIYLVQILVLIVKK